MTLTETVARAIEPSAFSNHDPVANTSRDFRQEHYLGRADLILSALAAAGPSEKMVEAGARGLCADPTITKMLDQLAGGHKAWGWPIAKDLARACLTAALAAEGE